MTDERTDSRKAAFDALMRVESGGYSTLTLDGALSCASLPRSEKALASALFYGCLERRILLDEIIRQFCPKKLERRVEIILRLGLYQMLFLDRVPDRAAVDESVRLCGRAGCGRASGLVNAVLRTFARADKKYSLPGREESLPGHLSIKYSCPEWIVNLWLKSYGEEICESTLQSIAGSPDVFIRVNNMRATAGELTRKLGERGVKATGLPWLDDGLKLDFSGGQGGGVTDLPEFREGLFHVQDASSQLCCALLGSRAGEVICDVCAAPGGKSFTLAELAGDDCALHAWDINPRRVALIQSGAERLGLNSISTAVRDATAFGRENPAPTDNAHFVGVGSSHPLADRVLCDVPCSGLGVIRRKPDIMLKKPDELAGLPALQLKILEASADLLRPGGTLVYSTCTLNPAENGGVAARFLASHPDFEAVALALPVGIERIIGEPDNQITLFPHIARTDGFFIAKFTRKV
ncbi:MAG: 16S rRNA (cytosine(967)-C(5))-methyltransferase RsmB [Oscillospiraceae bacterium]|nr:16S rRNA (cytosine(967)-C(5))-methyltransferase RsmB [Oscillospiraceae bacterium]